MSIQEHRRLIFGLPTLREAIEAHMPEIAPGLMPRGTQVKSVTVIADPLQVRIRMLTPGALETVKLEVSAAHLGAVLIRRCRAIRIPLPRNARKAVEGDVSGVAMLVMLTHEAPAQSQLSTHRLSA